MTLLVAAIFCMLLNAAFGRYRTHSLMAALCIGIGGGLAAGDWGPDGIAVLLIGIGVTSGLLVMLLETVMSDGQGDKAGDPEHLLPALFDFRISSFIAGNCRKLLKRVLPHKAG